MLKIRHLTRPGIEPVDLELAKGQCTALSGPSGAGKSILMRVSADLDPNEGEVSLNGRSRESIPAPSWRRQVVYVPAEAGWWADRVGDGLQRQHEHKPREGECQANAQFAA